MVSGVPGIYSLTCGVWCSRCLLSSFRNDLIRDCENGHDEEVLISNEKNRITKLELRKLIRYHVTDVTQNRDVVED